MKTVVITVWPDLDRADPNRDWVQNLTEAPVGKRLLDWEITKHGNRKEIWEVTISNHEALLLKLKHPEIKFSN